MDEKMQTEPKKKSWLDLILYVLSFIRGIFKQKQQEQQQQQQIENANFESHTQHLQGQYDKIDANTQQETNKINESGLNDVAENLNNRF